MMLVTEMVGMTSDELICKTLGGGGFFRIVAASSQMHMAIVEYVDSGGNAKVVYRHLDEFFIERKDK